MKKLPPPSNSYPALAPHFPKQKKEVTIWQHFLITTYRSIKIIMAYMVPSNFF